MLKMENRNRGSPRREFINGMINNLGGVEQEVVRDRYGNRAQYYGNRSKNTNRDLGSYTNEQLQEFVRLKSAVRNAQQLKREHSETFDRRLLEILHGYMREKNWTWKNDLQQKEEPAYECAMVLMNRMLDGNYFTVYELTEGERRNRYGNEPIHHIRFILFEHEQVGRSIRLGRYRDRIFQWSKRGLVKYVSDLIYYADKELSGESGYNRADISIDVNDLREKLIKAEETLIMAQLKYDVFSKINIEDHPKYSLACFLQVNSSDLLGIFAPNAYREAKMKKKAMSAFMKHLDPTVKKS